MDKTRLKFVIWVPKPGGGEPFTCSNKYVIKKYIRSSGKTTADDYYVGIRRTETETLKFDIIELD